MSRLQYEPRLSTRVYHPPEDIRPASPIPTLGEPDWDAIACEWTALDSLDRPFYGFTAEEVRKSFAADVARHGENARKSGGSLEQEWAWTAEDCRNERD